MTYKKGFANIVLIIVLVAVIILAGAGYLIAKRPAQEAAQPTPTSTNTPKVSASPTPALDETADWKTYRSEKYGYEMKYPKDWALDQGRKESVTLNSPENEKLLKKNDSGEVYGEGYMQDITIIYYDSIPRAATFDEFAKNELISSSLNQITFAGHSAYEAIMGQFGAYYSILINKNNHLYIIQFGNRDNKSKLTKTDNQILSTFKFIDEGRTVNWKTYSSPLMKFSIDYPSGWSVGKEEVLSTGTEIEFSKNQDASLNIRSGVRHNQDLGRNYTLKEWVTGHRDSLIRFHPDFTEKKITFAEKEATEFDYKITINNPPTESKDIFLESDASIYEITAHFDSSKENVYKPIIDQILSTFKFTK